MNNLQDLKDLTIHDASASVWLTDHFQVDVLVARFKFVNFREKNNQIGETE